MTKADNTGHLKALKSPPKPDPEALSPAQAAAVELLAVGKPDSEAAEAAGVTRQTVNGWRNHDFDFIAAVNRRRRDLWEDAHNRLRALATKAVNALEKALDGEPAAALPAALHVLRAFKIYGEVEPPAGPVTPEAVLNVEASRRAHERLAALPDTGDPLDNLLNEEAHLSRFTGEEHDKLRAQRELTRRARLKEGRSGVGGGQ